MKIPFNIIDFLDRAELVYGDRVGIVDEPVQPAISLGELTYREVARRARAIAAGLDALGGGGGGGPGGPGRSLGAWTHSASARASGWPSSATTPPGCWNCSTPFPPSAGCW